MTLPALEPLAMTAKAWPFELALQLVKRLEKTGKTGPVVFETGYGPSGLPHIGTFGEVVRTTMVRHAFEVLTKGQVPTRLICVSDDMDGMRKVPDNVPDPDALREHMQKPLTAVPDPFGTHQSFGHHNNARLRGFLDSFGFQYEFLSATDLYRNGSYDSMLLRALERYQAIMDVMLPTLGDERRATYSPFLPISPTTGRVLYVPMKAIDAKAGTITFDDENGQEVTQTVTGGHAKLQWKPDFGMRWAALGVDFEMFGKDHQANASVYSRITQILGAEPPLQFVYELFLDDEGRKISKTAGNGLAVEEWLRYAPAESLSLYMFQKPRTAKRLYFDVIPKAVDEYLSFRDKASREETAALYENPAWHIHSGLPPTEASPVSFALLLNLVSAANAESKDVLWGFIQKYAPDANPDNAPLLDRLVGHAITFYQERVKPEKTYRLPTEQEAAALEEMARRLEAYDGPINDAEAIQTVVYAVGMECGFAENLRDWFGAIYQVLLGQSQGPRFGVFIALYGLNASAALARQGARGELATPPPAQ
jgi:lysyl-tRNA synthetase class 1